MPKTPGNLWPEEERKARMEKKLREVAVVEFLACAFNPDEREIITMAAQQDGLDLDTFVRFEVLQASYAALSLIRPDRPLGARRDG